MSAKSLYKITNFLLFFFLFTASTLFLARFFKFAVVFEFDVANALNL